MINPRRRFPHRLFLVLLDNRYRPSIRADRRRIAAENRLN
jgi:hypothetical protein